MAFARLVVLEGPDIGSQFEVPMRGGGIGRDPDNLVCLSDPAVSRTHCTLAWKSGHIAVLDGGSRNRTLVNGQPVSTHLLTEGDEITVGNTRLAYLPYQEAQAAIRRSVQYRVTAEVGTRELLQAQLSDRGHSGYGRAHRHLTALARLGDRLRALDADEHSQGLGRIACEAMREMLDARRSFLFLLESGGRLTLKTAAVMRGVDTGGDADGDIDREAMERVMRQGTALALEVSGGVGSAIMVPLFGAAAVAAAGRTAVPSPIGILYSECITGPQRTPAPLSSSTAVQSASPYDGQDVLAAACLAHIVSAALVAEQARQVLSQENQALSRQLGHSRKFVGGSPAAHAVLDFVAKVGPSGATVLLTGESGSGKEMVARAIHEASRRRHGPFVAINCAALSENLIESELFGHEKGAFTGAAEKKIGRFELAHRGSLFLDEVGEMSLNCQTKFLRVLEEQVFERVGGGKPITVDVRVVAATNRNLADMVRAGRFREDLYYRLSVIHTVVPPLRARVADIPVLAEHFLAQLRTQVSRRIRGFAPETMEALMRHPWPGNVRELRNAVERAIVLGDGELIMPQHLPPPLSGEAELWAGVTTAMPGATAGTMTGTMTGTAVDGSIAHAAQAVEAAVRYAAGASASEAPDAAAAAVPPSPLSTSASSLPTGTSAVRPRPLRDLERDGILAALRATGGNKVQAAAILQIDRSTLYKKIRDYDIKL